MGYKVFKGSSSAWIEKEQRKKADLRCERQWKILCASFMMSNDCLFLKDLDFRYLAVSPEFCGHVGRRETEIIGRTDFDLFPYGTAVRQRIEDALVLGVCCSKFIHDLSDAQTPQALHYIKTPLFDEASNPLAIMGISRRNVLLTEEMNRLRAALREKDLMLREIHHRMKNNLAIISGLLKMQAGRVRDMEARRCLVEGHSRLVSMSHIHGILYSGEKMNGERFTMYIKMLMEDLLRIYGYGPGSIRINVLADDIRLNKREIMPCALIVNELMSNSLKYAFPRNGRGEIRVEFREVEGEGLVLSFFDNGVGLPASVDVSEPRTLGMGIVSSLVRQLDGTLHVTRQEGTEFKICFKAQSNGSHGKN